MNQNKFKKTALCALMGLYLAACSNGPGTGEEVSVIQRPSESALKDSGLSESRFDETHSNFAKPTAIQRESQPAHQPYQNLKMVSPGLVMDRTGWNSAPNSGNEYETLFETGFKNPVLSPLSTFGLDVDTASYSNLRRFINNGQLPPSDALRIEEMINYFDYPVKAEATSGPLSIHTELGQAPWNRDHQLAMIQVRTNAIAQNEERPNRFVFLIDTSGSMQGSDRLPLLKTAFETLVEELDAEDRVAIVTYAGSAGVALPSVSGADKNAIVQAIHNLQSGGSTAGAAGIETAYRLAREQFDPNANNRVILATDGDFNVGASSPTELIKLSEAKRDQGIYLTVLGFGQGNLGDGRMNRIAGHGDGNYYYIDSELEARRVLVDKLQRSLVTVARDVKLQIEFNPSLVAEYRLLGYETRRMAAEDFKDDKKDAGELGADQVVTALYEIIPRTEKPTAEDSLRFQDRKANQQYQDEVLRVALRYRPLIGGPANEIASSLRLTKAEPQSAGFQWASAVAEVGLVLTDSKFKANADLGAVLARTEKLASQGDSSQKEFVSLIRKARIIRQQIQQTVGIDQNNADDIASKRHRTMAMAPKLVLERAVYENSGL